MRVLSEEDAQRRGAARPDRLCCGRDGGGERMESADPGHRAVGGAEPVVVFPGGAGVLGRHFVFAGAGPHHPASAREKRAGRGAEEPPAAHDDDGAGRDAPQHPGGHGRRRRLRRISDRNGPDLGRRSAGALARHRHPEFPGGGHHLPAAARRGPKPYARLRGRRALGHRRAGRRSADRSGRALRRPRPTLSSELCGRRDALCGRGGADPRDVRGKALEHRHDLFRRRLQCDDDPGRLAGLNRARFRSDSM